MYETVDELLKNEQIHLFIGDRMLHEDDKLLISKAGGYLIQLSAEQAKGMYADWHEYGDPHGESFSGTLMHRCVNLNTLTDSEVDTMEELVELFRPDPASTDPFRWLAEQAAEDINLDSNLTVESVPINRLAEIVCGVTIEHPVEDQQLQAEIEFLAGGDVNDPAFIEKFKEMADDDEGQAIHKEDLLLMEDLPLLQEMLLDTMAGEITTHNVAKQLTTEGRKYGFEVEEILVKAEA